MKTLYDFINEYFAGRAKTRLYGIFIICIALFHLHIIFTALFVSQELIFDKYGLLKGEYIRENYLQYENVWFWLYELLVISLSAVFTWLMVWVLPRTLVKRAYTRELIDEFGRREEKLQRELSLQNLKDDITQARLYDAQKEKQIADTKEQIVEKEVDEWDSEYEELKKTRLFAHFGQLITAIAEHGGNSLVYGYNGSINFRVDSNLKTYAYANNLLTFTGDDKNSFDLTDKGKYFIKRYQQENE